MVDNLEFSTGNWQETAINSEDLPSPQGELYLRFHLPSGHEFALAAVGIREVIYQAPAQITAIPNASPLLLGTISLRGEIIWVADLGQFLGEKEILKIQRAEIPVLAVEDQESILGLAIEQIGGQEWLDLGQLRMATNIASSIAPFVQGEWILEQESNQVLRLLDHVAILRSARWVA
jgi:twitching motility protein PilI